MPSDSSPSSPSSLPALPLEPLLEAVGDATRWRILRELAAGEPLMVIEIAGRLRASSSLVSKHLARLRKVGAVAVGRAGLYLIPEPYLVSAADRVVDYGPIVLRMQSEAQEGEARAERG